MQSAQRGCSTSSVVKRPVSAISIARVRLSVTWTLPSTTSRSQAVISPDRLMSGPTISSLAGGSSAGAVASGATAASGARAGGAGGGAKRVAGASGCAGIPSLHCRRMELPPIVRR